MATSKARFAVKTLTFAEPMSAQAISLALRLPSHGLAYHRAALATFLAQNIPDPPHGREFQFIAIFGQNFSQP